MAGAFGGNSTEYSLKWNSHHSTIVSVLDSLLERESLVDVTLACEGKFINVHRFMLFACSPYFEELLMQQPKKQAIIFLKDVTFSNLQALIHFMYKGEVQVPEEQLVSFLQTAVSLKIKGLLLFDKEESQKVKSSSSSVPAENSTSSKGKSPQTVGPKVRTPTNSPVRLRTSIQPMIRKSIPPPVEIPPSKTVAPLESAVRSVEQDEPSQSQVMECQEPAGKKAKVMKRAGEEPTMIGKKQQAEKIEEPVIAEKQLPVAVVEEPVIAEKQIPIEESVAAALPEKQNNAMDIEKSAVVAEKQNQQQVEKPEKSKPAEKQLSIPKPNVVSKKLEVMVVESQILPSDIFDPAPINEEVDSGLDNEKQGDATEGSTAQEEDVEMDDETSSQEGAVTSNNNDSTVVAVNNAIDLVPEAASAPESVVDSQMDDDDENQSDNADDSVAGPSSRRSGLRKSRSSLTKAKAARRYSPSSYDRTTVKPHVCDKCGRSYAYKGSFLNHIKDCGITKVAVDKDHEHIPPPAPRQRAVTNDQNVDYHYCPMCSYCTAYRWNLKKHVENRHPEIPAEKVHF